jgi:hypothetical protein
MTGIQPGAGPRKIVSPAKADVLNSQADTASISLFLNV